MVMRAMSAMGVLAILLVTSPAKAQTATDAAAIATRRALLDDAQQARNRGDHAHALQSALSAARIEASASVALFICEEQQTLGQLGHAFESSQRCTSLAENNPGIPNRATILARCRELTDQLRPRVALVTFSFVSTPPSDARVTLNNDAIAQPGSAPVAVEPGTIVVDVASGGRSVFHREQVVRGGESASVAIDLTAPSTGTASASTSASAAPPSTGTTAAAPSAGPGPLPYVLAGAGALGLLATIPFYLARQSALGECQTEVMDPSRLMCTQSQADRANLFNSLTDVAWIAGGVLLAAGVTWWVVARVTRGGSSRAEHARRGWVPSVAPTGSGGAMFGIQGAF
jgi:hypothetical protein